LSPTSQSLSIGQTINYGYEGPASRLAAIWYGDQPITWGTVDQMRQNLAWGWYAGVSGDSTVDHNFTLRVYPSAYVLGAPAPLATDVAETSATIAFKGNVPTIDTINLGTLTVGAAADVTIDLGAKAHGFDWSVFGGFAEVTGLPAGLSAEMTNSVNGPWTNAGTAPVLHISGTPTAAGPYTATLNVYDAAFGEGGQTATTTLEGTVADAITLSPATVDITFNNPLDVAYNGPGDRLAALFDGNSMVVWDRADNIVNDVYYGMLATYLGGALANHEFTLKVYDVALPPFFPTELGTPAATTTVNFKSHVASVTPFDLGRLQVRVPYDQSFDLADYGVGFDWTNGGRVSISGLPAGLNCDLVNDPGSGWTDPGIAPIVRIHGTPTQSGDFTAEVTASDGAFPMLGQSGTGVSTGTVLPGATMEGLEVPTLVAGTAFTQTFDLATYSANFDWSHGGSVVVGELPAGLSAEIVNQAQKAPVVSANGEAPHLRIFGTPTVTGEFWVTLTLYDAFSASASADTRLLITSAQVPTDPAAKVTLPGSTATFTIPGLAVGATITPGTKAAGVDTVSVVDGDVLVKVLSTFSGLISQPVTVTQNGVDTVVHLVVKVYPTASKSNTFTLKLGNTYVHWSASPNAHGYKVIVNGHVDCTTSSKTTSCTIKGLLGPKAVITVVTVGGNNFTSRATAQYVKSTVVAPFGAVLFAADSSKLTVTSKLTIHNYAVAIAKQGFTTVTVEGYIAHWPSNPSAADRAHGIAVSTARAAAVRTYLVAEFKKLGVKVSVKTLGNGGSYPTVSNTSSSSAAGNRRADISVS
jgi:outer membrane protein OmpA-like peptidoglycan-associated protein